MAKISLTKFISAWSNSTFKYYQYYFKIRTIFCKYKTIYIQKRQAVNAGCYNGKVLFHFVTVEHMNI